MFIREGCSKISIKEAMKKQIWLLAILLIPIVMATSGCSHTTVVCNNPYIQVGTDCCLDKDSNGICDNDEDPVQVVEEVEEKVLRECLNKGKGEISGFYKLCESRQECVEYLISDVGESFSDLGIDLNNVECVETAFVRLLNSRGPISCSSDGFCHGLFEIDENTFEEIRSPKVVADSMREMLICDGGFCAVPQYSHGSFIDLFLYNQ